MATLFNTKISATYQGLLKTIDNAVLSATLRELTDGSGNQSGLFLNTAGDFKVTSVLEWGSLKDTGTGVTITQFVTAANGIENFNNDTTVPTSAAVKLYVDTKFSQTDTLTEVLGFGNTTSGKDIAVSAGDDITFTDSSKILMGASSDLEIYHDGSNSFIRDLGTGNLLIDSNGAELKLRVNTTENALIANSNGSVELYYNNIKRFETTTAGAEVTGNLVVTGTITGSGGSFLPLAGGTMTGNVRFNDTFKAEFGSGADLQINHDGTDSLINNGTGNLTFRNGADNQNIIFQADNGSGGNAAYIQINGSTGAVELNHYGTKKLETTLAGATVTGALSTTTDVTVGANATFVDNGKAIFGAGSDLQIYHDGTNSYIKDSGTGNLIVNATNFVVNNSGDTENMIIAVDGGATTLFCAGVGRLATTSTGVSVTGNLEVTGTITGSGGSFLPLAGGTMTGNTTHLDNVRSLYGTSSDLQIYHDSSNSYIRDVGTGRLWIDSNGEGVSIISDGSGSSPMAHFYKDAAVELYYNNSKKFETTSAGISVTGNGAFTGNVTIPDDQQLQFGNSNDLRIQHASGGTSFIQNYTGQLNIDQAAVTQSIVFRVSNANALDTTALTINREGNLTTGADVTIAGNLTVNGTTTTINTQTLAVEDPLIELSKDNAANSVDIGFYGKYNDGTARYLGLFSDASDSNKFRLFKGTTVEPTTTVNIAGAGYVAADLQVAGLEATSFTNTGDLFVEDNIYLTDATTTRAKIQLNSSDRDNLDIKAVSLGSTMNFFTVDTLALSLDASQNASFSGDVSLLDSKFLNLGSNNDLQLYHNATNSFISNGQGDLTIQNIADDKDIIFKCDDGSGGVSTYFFLDGGSVATQFNQRALFIDNIAAEFGSGRDLKIYHESNNSYIKNSAGSLIIEQSSGAIALRPVTNENGILIIENGAVQLYHDNSKKFETTSTGVSVTGDGVFSGTGTFGGQLTVNPNATTSVRIGTAGTNAGLIFGAVGDELYLGANNTHQIRCKTNNDVEFVANATFAGNVTLTSTAPLLYLNNTTGSTGKNWRLSSATNGKFFITQEGVIDAVTLDPTSGNATFAGDVLLSTSKGLYTNSIQALSNAGLKLGNDDNSGYVFVADSGNVGIGVAAPTTKLQVAGTISSSSTVENGTAQISILNANTATPAEQFYVGNNLADVDFGNKRGALKFFTGTTERMRITSAGELQLTQSNAEFDFTSSSSSGYKTTFNMDDTGLDIGHNSSARALNLQTNSADRLTITGSGNCGIGTASPNALALLDVSSTTKGVLLPRMTTTQVNAISSPPEGLTVYNTTLNTLCFYNGSSWQKVTSSNM